MRDQASLDDDDPAAWSQAVLRRQVQVLETLAEAGLELALAIKDQLAQAPQTAPADIAMAFSRVSRAVRMTCLLQARLIEDSERAAIRHDCERRSQDRRAREAEDEARDDRKARVGAIVGRVAWTQTQDEDRTESLAAEAAERLEDDDIYGDVLARPMGELVALICRDLGLEPDWAGLGQEAWAVDEMAGGDPSSPFVAPEAGEKRIQHQAHQAHQDDGEQGGGQGRRPDVPFHARL